MKDNKKKVEFDAVVRERKSQLGRYGQITSKKLANFMSKKVHVTIKVIKEKT
jgi:hypothetical protein